MNVDVGYDRFINFINFCYYVDIVFWGGKERVLFRSGVMLYQKRNQKQVHPRVITLLPSPMTLETRSLCLLGRSSRQLLKSHTGTKFTTRTCLHTRTYFASTLSVAVREAFSSVYPYKEVQNKTRIDRMVTKFRWMLVSEKVEIFTIPCTPGV
jgi:hypothetical protein